MRHKGLFLTYAAVALALLPASGSAQSAYRRANLINAADPNEGRCTVSVVVDGATDVELRGDSATLRDLSGRPPSWQRFECTGPLPYSPADLRIRAVEGRGRITLTHDSNSGGVAIVRIDDPAAGAEMYTFDVYWDNRDYRDNRRTQSYGDADRAMMDDDAMQSCRSAVESRIRGDGYRYVRFGQMSTDDRGRGEFVSGTATGDRPNRSDVFNFTCRVNPYDGEVRRVDVTRR
jgi:hypothetical protein